MSENTKIAVVGSGYVGLVAAVCFAEMGHDVICVDNDERKVTALQGGDSLIHEHYLPELLEKYRNTRVRFMTDLAEATRESEAIFIAVGTPQSEAGDADLSYVEAVACEIARSITSYKVIVEKSTVPVYTNEWITPRTGAQRRRPSPLRRRLQSRVPSRGNCRRRLPPSRPHRRRCRQRPRRAPSSGESMLHSPAATTTSGAAPSPALATSASRLRS